MASKKTFNIKDKVFAKIRGYPAWPAIVSGVKGDTPSRVRYNVYFYGTGERAECKPEDLCPYQDNKSKLGKPNKRKFFTEALLEIEGDASMLNLPELIPEVATPSNTSIANQELPTETSENITKIDKKNESVSESEKKISTNELNVSKSKKSIPPRKSLGISISKGTKRRLSDLKAETSSKKSMPNKSKVMDSVVKLKESQSPIVLVEALKDSVIERAQNKDKNIEPIITNAVTDETTDDETESMPNSNEELLNNTTTTKSIDVSLDNSKTKSSEVSLDDSKTKSSEVSLDNSKTKFSELSLENIKTTSTEVLLDNGKTAKSASKIKDRNSSGSEMSSGNGSNVGHVSRSGRKIKPKKYSGYENDGEMPKRSRLSKENSKSSDKLNTSSIDTDSSSEQNCKTKDKSSISERKIISKSSSVHINDSAAKDIQTVSSTINEDGEIPVVLKGLMVDALSNIETGWKKTVPNKAVTIELLSTEVNLLDYIHKLRLALRIDHANYEKALETLDNLSKLHINALMLIKHKEIVDTIKKVTKYVGNLNAWNLSKPEISQHTEKCTQIRRKAEILFNKCVSLFTVPDGETFQDAYNKEVEDFFVKTKHLSCDQIYGLTSDKFYK